MGSVTTNLVVRLLSSLLCVFVLQFLCVSSHARIGESLEGCIKLYGEPVKRLEKGMLFVKDGVRIYITFSQGCADCIFLQKIDPRVEKHVVPISELEIKRFLSENSQGFKWYYSSVLPDGDVIWITKDSELGALYSQATCSLQVYTRQNIVR